MARLTGHHAQVTSTLASPRSWAASRAPSSTTVSSEKTGTRPSHSHRDASASSALLPPGFCATRTPQPRASFPSRRLLNARLVQVLTSTCRPIHNSSRLSGRGAARSKVFRHAHEQETGRTSSIAQHSLCFNVAGAVLNDTSFRSDVACTAVTHAAKIISLVDLAGHERYFKTTAFGLTGHLPGARGGCSFAWLSVGEAAHFNCATSPLHSR